MNAEEPWLHRIQLPQFERKATHAFEDAGDGKDGGRRDLLVTLVDGRQQVLGRVVHAFQDVAVALRVGRPQHDDLVHLLGEVPDVRPDSVQLLLLGS